MLTNTQVRRRRQPPPPLPGKYVTLAGPVERFFEGDKDLVKTRTSYVGERTSGQGVTYKTFMAARGLSALHSGRPAIPIFSDFKGIIPGNILSNKFNKYVDVTQGAGQNKWELLVDNDDRTLRFNDALKSSVQEGNMPLVFLITTPIHAMIYIIDGPNLYTLGYGFQGVSDEFPNKLSSLISKTGASSSIAHMFETIRGAIYTADFLMPSHKHEGKLSWVGFLDMDMIDRIQEFLDITWYILYKGEGYKGEGYNRKYMNISNETILVLDTKYLESAGFLKGNANDISEQSFNCLVWAQKILNINIDCGFLGNPKNCKPISEEQFDSILNNIQNVDLPDIIEEIQKDLELPSNVCSRVSRSLKRCLGISGGKTKHKRKNKRKNKRKSKKNTHRRSNKRRNKEYKRNK